MKILIVEDDRALCQAVGAHLRSEGCQTDCCFEGETGCYYAMQNAHDLILLDWMLPRMDGLSLLRAIRAQGIHTPVLLITALSAVTSRVEGLDAGADDYLVKPFAIEELLARVRALTRRPQALGSGSDCLSAGDLSYRPAERELAGPAGSSILAKTEAALLELFLKNPDRTLTRAQIYLRVWGPDSEVEDQCVDNYVHFVRRRLKSAGSACRIETVRSLGYRLEALS